MSTFGGLNTAYTGLTAASQGLHVTGQNIANAGVDGYTRQRVETSSVGAATKAGLFAVPPTAGNGVNIDGIARLGDAFAENRVRGTASESGYTYVRADALTDIELSLHEPGTNGISARLQSFWSSWQDLSNNTEQSAPSSVLLEEADSLAKLVSGGYADLEQQWAGQRGKVDALVTELNDSAQQLARINAEVRTALNGGSSANELIDQRNVLAAQIADLAGGSVRETPDGMLDVYIGGNAIVQGDQVHAVKAAGSQAMEGAAADPARLEWVGRSITSVSLTGGQLAGSISVLAPADGGTGGAIAEAAASYNAFAEKLAGTVNAVHRTGVTADGTAGHDFFGFTAGVASARGFTVIPTSASGIAAGAPGAGGYDGSMAASISLLGKGKDSPDTFWNSFVTQTGAASRSATQAGTLAENAHNGAKTQLAARSEVSLDEETVNLVQYQQAYQANARVMTAIDEMLDTLISRTGLVGR